MKRRGNCYVTCEALYHLLGGRDSGWVPHTLRHEGDVHWYLARREGEGQAILDPTAVQFSTTPDYSKGRGRGFLTRKPSRRARVLMDILVWQPPELGGYRPRGPGATAGVKPVQRRSRRRAPA